MKFLTFLHSITAEERTQQLVSLTYIHWTHFLTSAVCCKCAVCIQRWSLFSGAWRLMVKLPLQETKAKVSHVMDSEVLLRRHYAEQLPQQAGWLAFTELMQHIPMTLLWLNDLFDYITPFLPKAFKTTGLTKLPNISTHAHTLWTVHSVK